MCRSVSVFVCVQLWLWLISQLVRTSSSFCFFFLSSFMLRRLIKQSISRNDLLKMKYFQFTQATCIFIDFICYCTTLNMLGVVSVHTVSINSKCFARAVAWPMNWIWSFKHWAQKVPPVCLMLCGSGSRQTHILMPLFFFLLCEQGLALTIIILEPVVNVKL